LGMAVFQQTFPQVLLKSARRINKARPRFRELGIIEMKKPRIASSSYLNAAPLCYSFVRGAQKDRVELISDAAPARCADLLAKNDSDAALIPVIEYARTPGLTIVPGACVSSRLKVKSVVVASKVPLEQIRSIALDTSSRTSAALVRILLGHFYRITPEYRQSPPALEQMLSSNDAALIIGDPAMLIDPASLRVFDLAEEWHRHTGLPFVFAFWAVRREAEQLLRDQGVDFGEAKREGIAEVEQIATDYSRTLGLPESELVSYLTENISYDLDAESLRGLSLYYELADQCGLIPAAPDLEFSRQ